MRESSEARLSLHLLSLMCQQGNIMAAETVEGVAAEARVTGARLEFPIGSPDPSLGVLVLAFDRPVPEAITFRDLRPFEQRVGDAAETAAIARLVREPDGKPNDGA